MHRFAVFNNEFTTKELMKTFILLLNIIASVNFIIMTSILMFRKNNTVANRFLGLIIVIPVFSIITNLLLYLDQVQPVFFLLYLTYFFNFLFGPTIFIYFNIMFGRMPKFKWTYLPHFVPAIIAFLIMINFLFLNNEEELIMIENIKAGKDNLYLLFNIGSGLHVLGYLILGWRRKNQYFKEVQSFFTDIEETKYLWIKKFLQLFITLIVIILFAIVLTTILFPPEYIIYADIITTPIVSSCIYFYVLYAAFNKHIVFTNKEYKEYKEHLSDFNEYSKTSQEANKYGKSALTEKEKNEIEKQLSFFLKEKKVYLEKTLDLKSLSVQVGVSSHQLSQFINTSLNKSFYDLINEYRIEESKRLLMNPDLKNLKIEAIGEMAGFSSRTSFFSVFKKQLNLTPTGFRNTQTSTNL